MEKGSKKKKQHQQDVYLYEIYCANNLFSFFFCFLQPHGEENAGKNAAEARRRWELVIVETWERSNKQQQRWRLSSCRKMFSKPGLLRRLCVHFRTGRFRSLLSTPVAELKMWVWLGGSLKVNCRIFKNVCRDWSSSFFPYGQGLKIGLSCWKVEGLLPAWHSPGWRVRDGRI